ncbi:FeoB-associated Cys-rich membrane protein [Polaribacter litorisediminis]|uniref:FeoB-associated Cys-rich membrane protein n=1 Tax=Polaribacter litorisediminis TaxID=1908341 RepID=UPI003F5D52BE
MEMAINSVIRYGVIGVCSFIFNLSNFKLMQEIIVYLLVASAVFFLIKKYFIPSKKEKKCSSDCGCH